MSCNSDSVPCANIGKGLWQAVLQRVLDQGFVGEARYQGKSSSDEFSEFIYQGWAV